MVGVWGYGPDIVLHGGCVEIWTIWPNITFTARKQRGINAGLRFSFLFMWLGVVPCKTVLPTFSVGLPTLVGLIQTIPHRHAQKYVSYVTLRVCQLDSNNYNNNP